MNELIAYITDNYPFVEEKYPELKDATEQGRLKFAIRHLALHFSKTAGKIAAVSEDADHGEEIDIEKNKGRHTKVSSKHTPSSRTCGYDRRGNN